MPSWGEEGERGRNEGERGRREGEREGGADRGRETMEWERWIC